VFSLFILSLLTAPPLRAETPAPAHAEWFARLAPSAVRVDFTLKHDDATPPPRLIMERAAERCAGCGEYHHTWISGSDFIRDERPIERMGWVVAPDTVLIVDPTISPRFIESIHIAFPNREKIPARAHALLKDAQTMMLLKTGAPIPGAQPLVFQNAQPPPEKGWLMDFNKEQTEWLSTLEKSDTGDAKPALCDRRGFYTPMEKTGLFLAEDGTPAGFLSTTLPLLAPPFHDGNTIPLDSLAETETRIAALCGNGIHLATLTFRSPRQDAQESRRHYWDDDGDKASTVQYAVAYHLAPGRFLIPWKFEAGQIARLESITLRDAEGGEVPAEFSASLENFQALIAVSPETASAPLALREGDARETSDTPTPVLLANITTRGGEMILKHDRSRAQSSQENRGDFHTLDFTGEHTSPAFNARGELLTLPVARLDRHNRYRGDEPQNFPAALLAALVANPPESEIDPANVPRSEREENRVAWMGVDLQPLAAQLAQEMKITHLAQTETNWRGQTEHSGAVAAFVYPGSPAEKAGVKAGDVLLRIHVEGRAIPLMFPDDDNDSDTGEFPWQYYDQIDAEYFEHLPMPWTSIHGDLNVQLTTAALGRDIRVAGFADGAEREFVMRVEWAPDTYESAPQFEAEALGVHARDLTFEVRHYFRRDADDPGVIISRVEPGSHAAVAGIKPYEIIVKVNDTEVRGVAEFEEQLRDTELLRLTVRRFNRERIVRVNLAEAAKPKGGLLNTLRGLVK